MMRAAAIASVGVVVGCSYGPGSFDWPGQHFPGQRATVGCLDVSVLRRPDMTDGPTRSAVLEYQFGNRCNTHLVVDLVRVPVVGRTAEGEVTLTPYDPNLEMMALKMGARTAGKEAIAYPFTQAIAQLCVDVAGIAAEKNVASHWLCFASKEETP